MRRALAARAGSSLLASSCVPASAWLPTVAQAQTTVLGLSAVEIQVRTAPFGLRAESALSSKINSMGNTSAMGDGAAEMTNGTIAALVQRDHQVLVAKATGGYARGIPPRGRPV